MKSAPGQRLGSLEIGRFIAASLVMLSHLMGTLAVNAAPGAQLLGGVAAPAPLGVQYFFVLSGFVMMTAHHRDFGHWASLPKFWWRRACRIYPLYWIVLIPIVYYVYHGMPGGGRGWRLFSLTPHYTAELISPAWSLRYEIAFYIMLGLCMLPRVGRYIFIAWAISILWLAIPTSVLVSMGLGGAYTSAMHVIGPGNHFISVFELYFFAGLAGGYLFVRSPAKIALAFSALVIGAILTFWGLKNSAWGFSYPQPFPLAVLSLGYAGLIFGFAMLERVQILRLGGAAATAGALSYPIYIVHAPIVYFMTCAIHGGLHDMALLLVFAAGLASIYGAASILAFFFDRPVQRLLRRGAVPKIRHRTTAKA